MSIISPPPPLSPTQQQSPYFPPVHPRQQPPHSQAAQQPTSPAAADPALAPGTSTNTVPLASLPTNLSPTTALSQLQLSPRQQQRSRGNSLGTGHSPRSAPVSPSGRLGLQGMTPLSSISPIQLSGGSPQASQAFGPQHVAGGDVGLGLTGGVGGAWRGQGGQSQGQGQPPARTYSLPSQPIGRGSMPPPAMPPPSLSGISVAGPSSWNARAPAPTPVRQQQQQQQSHGSASRSRTRLPTHFRHPSASSAVGTDYLSDEAFDSDATVRPGRSKNRHSLSQPDLTALRGQTAGQRRVEGWVDGQGRVMGAGAGQAQAQAPVQAQSQVQQGTSAQTERRRPSLGRVKSTGSATTNPIAIPTHSATHPPPGSSTDPWLPAAPSRSPHSRSHPHLAGMRKSPSPRSAPLSIPTMSPISSRASLPLDHSPRSSFHRASLGGQTQPVPSQAVPSGGMSSEDADDDYESTDSRSSDSITFSPKRVRSAPAAAGLRQRIPESRSRRGSSSSRSGGGLGLSLGSPSSIAPTTASASGPETTPKTPVAAPLPNELERMIRGSSLLSLRLLAVVPAMWGICVLVQALVTGGLWVDVWPYGVDLSGEALERLVAGGVMVQGEWLRVLRGDMLLCIAWAICTGHFCFCLTTGLTHRWLSYYSLPSTITRLASLQCLCWPATYITLWFLGARASRPLLAWVVIGVTTGWSRTVQMWVTSNVVPSDLASPLASMQPSAMPGAGDSPVISRRGSKQPATMPLGPPPDELSAWEKFTWGRRWDWDAVAREVGWKVGGLLLVTTAWLFWSLERGWIVRG